MVTVVDGWGKNSAGSIVFGLSSDNSCPGSRSAVAVIGRSSMLVSEVRADGGGMVACGVIMTVLVGDMLAVGKFAVGKAISEKNPQVVY